MDAVRLPSRSRIGPGRAAVDADQVVVAVAKDRSAPASTRLSSGGGPAVTDDNLHLRGERCPETDGFAAHQPVCAWGAVASIAVSSLIRTRSSESLTGFTRYA